MKFEYKLPKIGDKIGFSYLLINKNPNVFKPNKEYAVTKAKQFLCGGIVITVEEGTEFYNGEYRIIKL